MCVCVCVCACVYIDLCVGVYEFVYVLAYVYVFFVAFFKVPVYLCLDVSPLWWFVIPISVEMRRMKCNPFNARPFPCTHTHTHTHAHTHTHTHTTGAHPMSKLVVMDSRLPVTATVYAYSRYKVGDMNTSATPAVAFTAILENPLNETLTASFMFNFPHGIEPHTQRLRSQMSPNESQLYQDCSGKPLESIVATDPTACFEFCNDISACSSWTYDKAGNLCIIFGDVRMNGYQDGYSSGVKVRVASWDMLTCVLFGVKVRKGT